MTLYHYYEKSRAALENLSDLPLEEAQKIQHKIRCENKGFAARRGEGYLERRRELEQLVRNRFMQKGGRPLRSAPHYFVVEHCPWLETWYAEAANIHIHISKFEVDTVSFTYGDMFPTFSAHVRDGKEYRNKVYTYTEILELINKYGLPQVWNPNGEFGPERYIEAQVWSDTGLGDLLKSGQDYEKRL